MVRGIYTAATGALVAQSMVDNVANNLANVNTSGFKQTLMQISSAQTLSIYHLQTNPGQTPNRATPGVSTASYIGTLGTGAQVYDTPENFSQGALQRTGNPLDVALAGPNAFFAVRTPNGVRYTRDGQFLQDSNGNLTTQDGLPVLDTNGQPINLQPQGAAGNQGTISIATDGTISEQGRTVGQLAVVQFNNLTALRPEGDNRFVDTGKAGPAASTVGVQQGTLEKSNGNVVRSMVDLITAERWFDANERVIKNEDDATNLAITQVAKSQ
ncbi:MAG: flagellar basal-body rod protein FlgF [Vulcanimicrobiaceae bacterium]